MTDDQYLSALRALLGHLRAGDLWFHGAHFVTVGAGFNGDHKFYRQVYETYTSDFDGASEKAIAYTGTAIASPQVVSAYSVQILSTMPNIVGLTGHQIATAALRVEKQTLAFIEKLFRDLESAKRLSLGMNDYLAALANAHETFVYKLGQRVAGGQV